MTFEYTVIRSRRKSVTVSVSPQNEIVVRCPQAMGDSAVESFIESKADWLYKVIAENNVRRSDNEAILNFKEIMIGGQRFPLIISDRNAITAEAVYVKDIQSVKKTLIKLLSADLICFAKRISAQIKLRAADFNVKAYKSRWGCCDKNGVITFNCLLIMLPLYLQRYVIIHELCHTAHFNHSTKFWKLVAKFEPNYKFCRQNLKDFNFLTKLY